MKKIFILLMFLNIAYSESLKKDTYIMELQHIDNIKYAKDNFTKQPLLSITLKKTYWEDFFALTLLHLKKKLTIKIDDITVDPYILSPLYYQFQISIPNDTNISKNIKALMKQHQTVINVDDKSNFLEKMLLKYDYDSNIVYALISEYHTKNTPKSSQKCIDLYEKIDLKNIKLEYVYNEVFDCYSDLNKTKKAFKLLNTVKPLIKDTEQYSLLEKKALLFSLENNKKEARKYYKKALFLFTEIDFLRDLNLSSEEKKQFSDMKKKDILRFEKIISDLK